MLSMFSIIIPIFNRPDEIDELLLSLSQTAYNKPFEIVIVEDGSTVTCEKIIEKYKNRLEISYYFKQNSGPGDSRNFGMQKAKGDYFIIFDSDCVIPAQYLNAVEDSLSQNYVDCFGGPDAAHQSFSDIQKAINFSMTSMLTTGGIRGGSEAISKFQPRSFNMGISKKAFLATGGFGKIHPGEDPDLTLRIWKEGFETKLIKEAYVFHKRRINWKNFKTQVSKFGKTRPILNSWHPKSGKLSYFFPTVFILGFFAAIMLSIFQIHWPILLYGIYFLLIFVGATISTKNLKIGLYAMGATFIQFYGYGIGFLQSFILIQVMKKNPQETFPKLFFK